MRLPKKLISRLLRKGILFVAYSLIFAASLTLAYEFRDGFSLATWNLSLLSDSLLWVVGIKMLSMTGFRQFRGLLSYFRLPDVYRLALALAIPTTLFLFASFYASYGFLESKSSIA